MGKWWYVHCHRWRLHGKRPSRWLPKGRGTFKVGVGRFKFALDFCYGKGIWVRERETAATCGTTCALVHYWPEPSMKKRIAKGALDGDVKHLAPVESNIFTNLMPLVEHCAIRRYDDGEQREPGWFTVKTQGSAWVVQVKDPDGAVSFSAVGQTLDNALETAALLLACDEAPWEPDRFLAGQKATGKKK